MRLAPSLEQGTAAFGQLHALAQLEGVVVGDDDLRLLQVGQHVVGNQLAALVVAVRVVRLQHAQAVLDGDAGGDHEKAAREAAALGPAHRVDGLPGDQHRHDRGLAGPGRQLEGQPRQFRVGVVVGVGQMVEEVPAGSRAGGDFGEPDGGLRGFELAEEGADAAEVVVPPVPEQAGRLRGHLPLGRVRQLAPAVDLLADPVDDGGQVVLLAIGPELLRPFVEHHRRLLPGSLAFPGLRDRRDELRLPAALDGFLGRLPGLVQLPVPVRPFVGGVEDGALEERVSQGGRSLRVAGGRQGVGGLGGLGGIGCAIWVPDTVRIYHEIRDHPGGPGPGQGHPTPGAQQGTSGTTAR